jgi:hypothetical protein
VQQPRVRSGLRSHGIGRERILVWKANNVSVENLTACNFQGGSGSVGNEIWWNGGDGSGKIGGNGYYGAFLNATSTFFKDNSNAAAYGIFSSNWSGGTWYQTYASNMNDSDYYIGAASSSATRRWITPGRSTAPWDTRERMRAGSW